MKPVWRLMSLEPHPPQLEPGHQLYTFTEADRAAFGDDHKRFELVQNHVRDLEERFSGDLANGNWAAIKPHFYEIADRHKGKAVHALINRIGAHYEGRDVARHTADAFERQKYPPILGLMRTLADGETLSSADAQQLKELSAAIDFVLAHETIFSHFCQTADPKVLADLQAKIANKKPAEPGFFRKLVSGDTTKEVVSQRARLVTKLERLQQAVEKRQTAQASEGRKLNKERWEKLHVCMEGGVYDPKMTPSANLSEVARELRDYNDPQLSAIAAQFEAYADSLDYSPLAQLEALNRLTQMTENYNRYTGPHKGVARQLAEMAHSTRARTHHSLHDWLSSAPKIEGWPKPGSRRDEPWVRARVADGFQVGGLGAGGQLDVRRGASGQFEIRGVDGQNFKVPASHVHVSEEFRPAPKVVDTRKIARGTIEQQQLPDCMVLARLQALPAKQIEDMVQIYDDFAMVRLYREDASGHAEPVWVQVPRTILHDTESSDVRQARSPANRVAFIEKAYAMLTDQAINELRGASTTETSFGEGNVQHGAVEDYRFPPGSGLLDVDFALTGKRRIVSQVVHDPTLTPWQERLSGNASMWNTTSPSIFAKEGATEAEKLEALAKNPVGSVLSDEGRRQWLAFIERSNPTEMNETTMTEAGISPRDREAVARRVATLNEERWLSSPVFGSVSPEGVKKLALRFSDPQVVKEFKDGMSDIYEVPPDEASNVFNLYSQSVLGGMAGLADLSPEDTVALVEAGEKHQRDTIDKTWQVVKKHLDTGNPVTTTFQVHGNVTENGLIGRHAYTILDAYADAQGQRWVKLQNPWGHAGVTYSESGELVPSDHSIFALKLEDFAQNMGAHGIQSSE